MDKPHLAVNDDFQRDAQKYQQLLLALDRANQEFALITQDAHLDIDTVLARLLPDLTEALQAEQGFVACRKKDDRQGNDFFEITAATPAENLCGQSLAVTGILQKLVREKKAQIKAPLDETEQSIIPGLEIFKATSAILVEMTTCGQSRVLGLCNNRNSGDIFLAADRMALDSIVELVAVGIRIGEERRRELQGIQETSAAISSELHLGALLPMIVESAARVFGAPAVSLMLWDNGRNYMTIQAKAGLSDMYADHQKIPGEEIYKYVGRLEGYHTLYIPDLLAEPVGNRSLIEKEGLRTVLSTPLVLGEELHGILNIYSKEQIREFTLYQRKLAKIFANQAAIAINNARLFDERRKQRDHLLALHEATKAISTGFTGERKPVLDRIVEQVVERIMAIQRPKAVWSALLLCDEISNRLQLECAYPAAMKSKVEEKLESEHLLCKPQDWTGYKGITVRTFLKDASQLVGDVDQDPDYIEVNPSTRSELAVPLRDGGKVIGVLNVESDEPYAFDDYDVQTLQSMAELAVIVIKNAEQVERLNRTNTVAVMGAWGAYVVHDVNREVGTIRLAVQSLLNRPDLDEDVKARLQDIDQYASWMRLPAVPDVFPEPGEIPELEDPPLLGAVVTAVIDKVRQELVEPSEIIDIAPDLQCSEIPVAMPAYWLSRLTSTLLWNAVQSIAESNKPGRVTVRTRFEADKVVVEVDDTGNGIPFELENLLFKQPFPISDKGLGKGLLLVSYVIEAYGGKVWLADNRPGEGACFAFYIPVAAKPNASKEEK